MRWHVCVRGLSSQWVLPFTTCRPRPQVVACVLSSTFKRGLNGTRYSKDETKRFREMIAENKSLGEIAEVFPERTFMSIRSKWTKITRAASPSSCRRWSEDEKQRLLDHKLLGTPWSTIAQQFPDRSLSSLNARWRRLAPAQLRKDTRSSRPDEYTEQEDAIIKECLKQGMHWKQIATDHFPNRTLRAIRYRCDTIGERSKQPMGFKWTAEIEQRLKKLYEEEDLSFVDIGKTLGCSVNAARARNSILTRGHPRHRQAWSEEANADLLVLIQAGRSLDDMAKAFPEKTYAAVRRKAYQLRRRHDIPVSRQRRSL
ncbi:Transcriptional activator Myb [Pseudocercospora fuligena]|uniref:Transcriptional activator Myb n=1 Tax=Pseudocercospora fuligena TaxID=685502 RepID=A0A8H6RNP6_9PEZI|nr:Transcriptional activator Myb [Pseudocercospora fuligena]